MVVLVGMLSTTQEKAKHMPRNNWYVTGMSLMNEIIPSILMPIVAAIMMRCDAFVYFIVG